jgi:hypothetical protein
MPGGGGVTWYQNGYACATANTGEKGSILNREQDARVLFRDIKISKIRI